jgi:hypothetical protein
LVKTKEKILRKIPYNEIDEEIRELVKALNRVPGLRTFESCHGHGKHELFIWIRCNSISSLNKFLWGMRRRFSSISTHIDDKYRLLIFNGNSNYFSKTLKLILVGPIGETKENCDFLAEKINDFVDTKNFPKKRNLEFFQKVKSLLIQLKIIET